MSTTMRCAFGVSLAAALAVFTACDQRSSPVAPTASPSERSAQPVLGSAGGITQELAALKQATASFHDLDKAMSAGWDTQLTPCLSLAGAGAQGFHYANQPLIDGSITPLQPELLLYEPRGNSLHLVGVEYIIPFTAWTASTPPSLYGETFHRNEALGLWALHVWLWKPNPSGLFADWNPQVSCEGA